ncbi:superfamily I DNA/RNA helicase [Paraburkholderia youngii]
MSQIFSMVLVDEYQDTKDIQYQIIGSILRAGAGRTDLFMVGDPNQGIYGSLGGYPIELMALRELTGLPIVDRELAKNYRSSQRIIEYFGNYKVYGTQIEAAGKERLYKSLVTYNQTLPAGDLVLEIAKLIRYNIHELGIPPQEICVLAPRWIHLAAMTRRLVTEVPECDFDGPGMVPFARDIENFWYKLARLALTEPSPSMYIRRLRWAGEIVAALSEAGVPTTGLEKKVVLKNCNAVRVEEIDGLRYLEAFFDALFLRLGVDYRVHAVLREHHAAFFASSLVRLEQMEREGVQGSRGVAFFRKVFQNRSGVTVSTIHGVKGAEFDVVIAYALLEGMVPHFSDQNKEQSARKLLYVAGSRARKNLHFFSETGRNRGGNFGEYEPTKVLAECAFNYDDI